MTPHVYEQSDFSTDQQTLTNWRSERTPRKRPSRARIILDLIAEPILIVALTVAVFAVCAATASAHHTKAECGSPAIDCWEAPQHQPADCYEDQPCFNWATMGNMQRGVTLNRRAIRLGVHRSVGRPHPSGVKRERVVNPCEFAFLHHSGFLNWKGTPRLTGDRLAQKHGCDYAYFG